MIGAFGHWQPWIEALGWALLHFIWQGVVVGAAYALLRRMVPKQHCDLRYFIGLGAMALLAFCPVFTLWMMHPQSYVVDSPTLGALSSARTLSLGHASTATARNFSQYLPWLVLIWVIGALLMVLRAARQWRVLARLSGRLTRHHADLDRMLERLAARFGISRVRVLISRHIDTPTLAGWFKPVILLPASVALGFPREQVELILAHELGHLRRYDHMVNLAQAILETLLYYHPVVHWISRDVRREREICCDELVLRVTHGEPRVYARTLAALEEMRYSTNRLAVAATGGVLLDRVRRILCMPSAPRLVAARPNAALWLVIAATMAVASTAALRIQQQNNIGPGAVIRAALDRLPRPDARALVDFGLNLAPQIDVTRHLAPPRVQLQALAPTVRQSTTITAGMQRLSPRVETLSTLDRPRIALTAPSRGNLQPSAQPFKISRLQIALAAPVQFEHRSAATDRQEAGDSDNSNCIRRTGSLLCRHLPNTDSSNMTIIYGGGDTEGGSHRIGP
ncbi:MAG: M56 family metallopeptidase [Rhodanobacteraceae bacterium]